MTRPTKKQTAKEQGVPSVYLGPTGNFKPGYDASLKRDLVAAVLGLPNPNAFAPVHEQEGAAAHYRSRLAALRQREAQERRPAMTASKERGAKSRKTIAPGVRVRTTVTGERVFEFYVKRGGEPISRTLKAKTLTDAKREARAEIAKLDAGTRPVGRNDIDIGELRDEWEPWARSPGSKYAPRTVEMYRDLLDRRVLPILGATTKVAAIKPVHLRGLIDKLNADGCSGAYVHQHVRAVSALLRFAVRRGIIEHNPVRLLDRGDRPSAKRTKEPNYLDLAQAERLLAELPDLWRPVAALCLYAALRISEALALRWCDLDFEADVVHVPGTKTEGSRADVPMIAPLKAELEAHRRRQPGVGAALVFRTASGRSQERHNAARAIRAAGVRAKIDGQKPLSPHDLRHSCAALLLEAGVPAPKVAAIMRHADPRVTLTIYAGITDKQRAALRGDLESAFS
jgi:integrase